MGEYSYIIKRTCHLSRWDENIKHRDNPITFHSLCAKIFASISIEEPTLKNAFKLEGDEMWGDVEKAVNAVTPEASKDEVNRWYYAIREHFNGGKNINEIKNGYSILERYLDVRSEGLNYEESFQTAKNYLDQDKIKKIRDFYYDYIILVDIEKLDIKNNRNAKEFKDAFLKWNARNTKKNIYVLDSSNNVKSKEIFEDTEEEFKVVYIEGKIDKEYEDNFDPDILYLEDILVKDEEEAN